MIFNSIKKAVNFFTAQTDDKGVNDKTLALFLVEKREKKQYNNTKGDVKNAT